jgi:REP element-mobilizing transposase RayT
MPRKLRLEFAGALYHVISRGNYQKPPFEGGAGPALEKTLFEACAKCGWRLHAYVVMNNHYHLAVSIRAGVPHSPSGMKNNVEHLEFSEENDPTTREEIRGALAAHGLSLHESIERS